MIGQLWLLLVLKESIMKNLIVDINFPHFRLHPLSHFLFQSFVLIVSLFTYFGDSSSLDEFRKFERCLMDSSFVLKVSSLLAPMPWNRD